jgi:Tat protein secretion system quality control protein TatD with DNase activity
MDLHLTDVEPVFYRPYCMSFGECGEIERIVQELNEADIIEETDSPFASPVLLVREKKVVSFGCVWITVNSTTKLWNSIIHYPT